ncbi:OmpA family protein [uncultured Rhodoblastus sp.]|uniref:OmpA family protein n=1 Tax=uncultured Rhodoblastus sp. TaxID=543037 RepID=UPI0025E07833|nr:OmpA family protein [uncultured Rhodoblastus sp.]
MCLPGKWWIGLLPLLALWLALNRMETGRIEAAVAAQADAALAQVSGERGFSAAAGRDVSLNGWIFGEPERRNALATAAAASGVRVVEDGLSEPPTQDPYLWRAAREGGMVILSGAAPSPGERAAVVAAASEAIQGARIIDQMSYFSGAAKNFTAQARAGLQLLAHLSTGSVQLRGGELILSGRASSGAEYRAAVAQAQSPPEGVTSVKADLSPPEAGAWVFEAVKGARYLNLSGVVGSQAEHTALLAEAAKLFPDLAPVDSVRIVPGAPARFGFNAAYVLRALAQLKSGKASLVDDVATLSGQARAGMDAMSVVEAIGAAQGVTLDAKGVQPGEEPVDAMAARKTEAALILTGFYADDAAHEKILGAARALFPGLVVTDEMQPGAGAGKSFLAAALAGLGQLARLHVGRFGLHDQTASLSGDAGRAETAEEVKTAFIAAMPDGFSVETNVTGAAREAPQPFPLSVPPSVPLAAAPLASAALDPQSCQSRLMETVGAAPLRFDYRSARLRPESSAVIEALAAVARTCPAASFELIATAQDYIHIQYNRNLSRRRAETVAAALAAAGIDARRFTPRKPEEERELERAKIGGVEFIAKGGRP